MDAMLYQLLCFTATWLNIDTKYWYPNELLLNLSISTSGTPWYCSNVHIISETPSCSSLFLSLIVFEVLSVILAPINLLSSLWKLCTAAECVGDASAAIFSCTVFVTELQNIHILIDWLHIVCISIPETIWLPELIKPEFKVLPFSSSSCASVSFTLAFALTSTTSSFHFFFS